MHDALHAQLVLVRAAEQVRVHRLHRERERVVCALAQARARDEDQLGLRLRCGVLGEARDEREHCACAEVRRVDDSPARNGELRCAADGEQHDVRDPVLRALCGGRPCFLDVGFFERVALHQSCVAGGDVGLDCLVFVEAGDIAEQEGDCRSLFCATNSQYPRAKS